MLQTLALHYVVSLMPEDVVVAHEAVVQVVYSQLAVQWNTATCPLNKRNSRTPPNQTQLNQHRFCVEVKGRMSPMK